MFKLIILSKENVYTVEDLIKALFERDFCIFKYRNLKKEKSGIKLCIKRLALV